MFHWRLRATSVTSPPSTRVQSAGADDGSSDPHPAEGQRRRPSDRRGASGPSAWRLDRTDPSRRSRKSSPTLAPVAEYRTPEYHPAFEEYCEAVFELQEDDVDVIQARIAERLQVSRPRSPR